MLILIELLIVQCGPHAPGILRDHHQRARICGSRMLDQPSREVLVKGRVHFFGQIEFMRWGREVTGALPSGTEISEGIKEQDPKSVFEVENTSGNSQRTSPSCSIAGGVQPRSCK